MGQSWDAAPAGPPATPSGTDPRGAWEAFLALLEGRIGANDMETMIRPALRLDEILGSHVRLGVTNRWYHDWIQDNLIGAVEGAWSELLGRAVSVELVVDPTPIEVVAPPSERRVVTRLDATKTFENFVVGRCNEFAHAAATAVADAPGSTHNPLFIYGDSGLGKTHLVHAIGNRIASRLGPERVYYCTAEHFFSSMVDALRTRTTTEFRERFRDIDVLLLDDVQFIAGRDRTQEEVFHIYEVMRAAGKQIVFTADQPPSRIAKLEPRVRTRFEGGLLADVQPPDVETMLAILVEKASQMRDNRGNPAPLDLPEDVQFLVAQRVRNSVRELEGVLQRLSMMKGFYGRPITMAFIQERMRELLPAAAPPPNGDRIIQAVAEHFNIRAAEIRGNRRPANIVQPRQMAMYLCRKLTSMSFPEIGREFNKDNSTVQHGVKKMEDLARTDANVRTTLELIERRLKEA